MIAPAQLWVLGTWFGVGLMLVGLGSFVRRLCGAPAQGTGDLLRSLWVGWALLLVLLQVWYLFLPVDQRALVAMAVVGAIGLLLGGSRSWRALLRGLRRSWLPLLACALLAIWLSNRALSGARFGDTSLYHVPKVRWIVEHAIVPGLANLYVALGHNQTSFLYMGMLDFGPFVGRSYHVANGMLALTLIAQCILSIAHTVRRGRSCTAVDTFYALLSPVILGFGVSIFLTCPAADMAVSMLGIVLSGELLRVLTRPRPLPAPDFDLVCLALLAIEAATVKLSIAALAGTAGVIGFLSWLWRERRARRGTLRTVAALALVAAICCGLWMLGNVILSGYALFPQPYGAVPVEWRIPFNMKEWVEAIQLGAPLVYAWKDPHWFVLRLQSLGWGGLEATVPLILAAAAAAVVVLVQLPLLVLRRGGMPRVPFIVVLPAIASLLFTLQYAPVIRYAGAALWVLAAQVGLFALGGAAAGKRRLGRVVAVVVSLVATAVMLSQEPHLWLPLKDFEISVRHPTVPTQLETGLVVQVPTDGLCGDAPLPCTPHPHPALRLRRDGDLSGGFMMDPRLFEEYKSTPWHAARPRSEPAYATSVKPGEEHVT
jgi:hypothetical protein